MHLLLLLERVKWCKWALRCNLYINHFRLSSCWVLCGREPVFVVSIMYLFVSRVFRWPQAIMRSSQHREMGLKIFPAWKCLLSGGARGSAGPGARRVNLMRISHEAAEHSRAHLTWHQPLSAAILFPAPHSPQLSTHNIQLLEHHQCTKTTGSVTGRGQEVSFYACHSSQ